MEFSVLSEALCHHGVGNFYEARDIRADNEVALFAALDGSVVSIVEDALHDALELCIDFLEGPAQTHAVLAHFKAAGGNAAGVGCLCRSKEDAGVQEGLSRLVGAGHVGAFSYAHNAVLDEGLCGVLVDLVLSGAGKSDVALDGPDALAAFMVLGALDLVGIFLDTSAVAELDVLDDVELDALGIVDVTVGIAQSNDLCAESLSFFSGEDGNVAGTGDDDGLALEAVLLHALEHFLGEVAQTVAGGFRAGKASAVGKALAGEDAGVETVGDALVFSEEIADLAAANADVAGGNVGELADVAIELMHEALAETHDLGIGFALGVEIGAALAAAHGEGGQAVFEDLLEAKELDDGGAHCRMEAKAALVRPNGGVELDAVAAVDVELALVVIPGDTELNETLRLDERVYDAALFIAGIGLDQRLKAFEDFLNGLEKFGLVGIALFDVGVYAFEVLVGDHFITPYFQIFPVFA